MHIFVQVLDPETALRTRHAAATEPVESGGTDPQWDLDVLLHKSHLVRVSKVKQQTAD